METQQIIMLIVAIVGLLQISFIPFIWTMTNEVKGQRVDIAACTRNVGEMKVTLATMEGVDKQALAMAELAIAKYDECRENYHALAQYVTTLSYKLAVKGILKEEDDMPPTRAPRKA